jgi:hypothetical protein
MGSRSTTANSICTPARYADILYDRLRCYLKPVLNGIYVKHHILKDGQVSDYEANTGI